MPLWPFDISQRICASFGWISLYLGDAELDPSKLRGYMVRPPSNRLHSAADPAQFWCVVASSQPMGWQHITWTKEMLQVLDGEDALTNNSERLREMLDQNSPPGESSPPHVV